MAIVDKIKKLTSQLFPTGRAFKIPLSGEFEKLRDGLAASEARYYADAMSILDSMIPDNDNFSLIDAAQWERRLGLITNTSVPLADRKLAIERKMSYPGTIRARQHYLSIQRELQAAGFDVYVHENLDRSDPDSVVTEVGSQHGDFQHGDSQHGGVNSGDRVVNSIMSADDEDFNIGAGFSNVFFIGAPYVGMYADVDAERETEFRQLILKLKPQNQIAYLLINYV